MERSYFCPEDDISFSIQSFLTGTEKLKIRELNREWHQKVIHCYLDLEKDRLNIVFPFFLNKKERLNDFWFSMYDRHFLSFVKGLELRINNDDTLYDEMDMNLVVYPRTIRRIHKFLENMPEWLLEISKQKIWKIRILNSHSYTPTLHSFTLKSIIIEKLYEMSIFH